MCKLCDDSLLAAAQAASLLASAAKALYDCNHSTESKALAKAAANLFEEPKVSPQTGDVSPNASKGAPEDVKPQAATATGDKLAKGWHIDEHGLMYLDDIVIGRAVVIKPPVRH